MKVSGAVAVVTGAGGGIGAALGRRLVENGARVVVADLHADKVESTAHELCDLVPGSAVGLAVDVSETDGIRALVDLAERRFGPVDVYAANAGIGGGIGLETDDDSWQRIIDVNVLAHVRAARLLVPTWLERGRGQFVTTASAAGLLTQIGSPSYSVTKHAAVAFAEWLAITYGDQGILVSCLCPMGVNTDMLTGGADLDDPVARRAVQAVTDAGGVLEPLEVADAVMAAIESETFLVLPHPEVLTFWRRKSADYDRWLSSMRRYQASLS
ncbi:SDR family oxidoreductase [Aeromicrobium halocynthiae]|uniref:SDR family oxidoreductase n=1 Tax=Aeromicrobium halocynthiae TaxID=560557 RepID=A0ABN2VVA7_9ACTN